MTGIKNPLFFWELFEKGPKCVVYNKRKHTKEYLRHAYNKFVGTHVGDLEFERWLQELGFVIIEKTGDTNFRLKKKYLKFADKMEHMTHPKFANIIGEEIVELVTN